MLAIIYLSCSEKKFVKHYKKLSKEANYRLPEQEKAQITVTSRGR